MKYLAINKRVPGAGYRFDLDGDANIDGTLTVDALNATSFTADSATFTSLTLGTLTGLIKGTSGVLSAIAAGTSAQYLRGDLTMQTLNQAAVAGLTTASSPTFAGLTVGDSNNKLSAAFNVGSTPPAPSYSNPGGTGDRTALITVTTDLSVTGTINPRVINGNKTTQNFYFNNQTVAGKYIKFDFGAGVSKVITEVTYYQQNATTHGVWRWQGSNDNTTWITIGADFTFGAATQTITTMSANIAGYRYYRMLGVSGSASNSPYVYQFEFKIDAYTAPSYSELSSYKTDGATSAVLSLNPDGGNVGVGNSNPVGLFSVGPESQFQVNAVGTVYSAGSAQFDGTITGGHLVDASLTSGRVAYVTTSGQLIDSANLTYDGSVVQVQFVTDGGFRAKQTGTGVANGCFAELQRSSTSNQVNFRFNTGVTNNWAFGVDATSVNDLYFYSYGGSAYILYMTYATGKIGVGGVTNPQEALTLPSAGKIAWEASSGVVDTNLYRSAANALKTDDSFSASAFLVGATAGVDMASGTPKGVVITKGIVTAATSVSPAGDGTYASPTSITISGGIITAIS